MRWQERLAAEGFARETQQLREERDARAHALQQATQRGVQYQHEIRKKEREVVKLREQVTRLLKKPSDTLPEQRSPIEMTAAVKEEGEVDGNADLAFCKMMIRSYEVIHA